MKKNKVTKYSYILGFAGFFGFSGLTDKTLGFLCFIAFGIFSNFWWYKLGNLNNDHLVLNKNRACSISFRICFGIAFVLTCILGIILKNFEILYKLQLIILSLSLASALNLWAFLTYKFSTNK